MPSLRCRPFTYRTLALLPTCPCGWTFWCTCISCMCATVPLLLSHHHFTGLRRCIRHVHATGLHALQRTVGLLLWRVSVGRLAVGGWQMCGWRLHGPPVNAETSFGDALSVHVCTRTSSTRDTGIAAACTTDETGGWRLAALQRKRLGKRRHSLCPRRAHTRQDAFSTVSSSLGRHFTKHLALAHNVIGFLFLQVPKRGHWHPPAHGHVHAAAKRQDCSQRRRWGEFHWGRWNVDGK